MNDEGQVMPSFDALCTVNYTPKQWLQYYRNIWVRNLMASMTDIAHDSAILAAEPDAVTEGRQDLVPDGKGSAVQKTMAQRLEERKANARRANQIIAAVDSLAGMTDDELTAAIASDSDMLKAIVAPAKEPTLVSFTVQAGKSVTTDDEVVHAEGTTVDLDPDADQTKGWVTDGSIAPTQAGV
jgi:hypothetical protein